MKKNNPNANTNDHTNEFLNALPAPLAYMFCATMAQVDNDRDIAQGQLLTGQQLDALEEFERAFHAITANAIKNHHKTP